MTDLNEAWVELYDDKGFKDRRLTVRYLQYPDGIPDLKNVNSDDGARGFGDKASSARWKIPEGWECILYRHDNFGDPMTRLIGHGWTQRGNLPTQGIKVLELDTKGGFNISFTTTPGYSDNASSLSWSGQ